MERREFRNNSKTMSHRMIMTVIPQAVMATPKAGSLSLPKKPVPARRSGTAPPLSPVGGKAVGPADEAGVAVPLVVRGTGRALLLTLENYQNSVTAMLKRRQKTRNPAGIIFRTNKRQRVS